MSILLLLLLLLLVFSEWVERGGGKWGQRDECFGCLATCSIRNSTTLQQFISCFYLEVVAVGMVAHLHIIRIMLNYVVCKIKLI